MPGHQLHGEGEQLAQLFADLAAVQGELGGVIKKNRTVEVQTKKGGVYTYAYATLDAILAAAVPRLAARGMTITQFPKPLSEAAGCELITLITHPKGGVIEIGMPLGRASDIQDLGKRITYMRRYVVQGLLGLAAEEDTDGPERNGQEKRAPQERPTQQRPRGQNRGQNQGQNRGQNRGRQQQKKKEEPKKAALTEEQAAEVRQIKAMLSAKFEELGAQAYRQIVGPDPTNLDEAKAACLRLSEAERMRETEPPPPADAVEPPPPADAIQVLAEARGAEEEPPPADQMEMVPPDEIEQPPAEPAGEWHDGY